MSSGSTTHNVFPISLSQLNDIGIDTAEFEKMLKKHDLEDEESLPILLGRGGDLDVDIGDDSDKLLALWDDINKSFSDKFPSLYLSTVFYNCAEGECYDTLDGGLNICVENAMIPNPEAAKLNLTCETFSTWG